MRHLRYILTLLLVVLCAAACTPRQDDVTSAAMDIYTQYADHSATLTVAYVGDYQTDGLTYNAVMFQTPDSAEWEWLKAEFSVVTPAVPLQGGIMMGDTSMLQSGAAQPADGQSHGVVMASLEIDTTRDFKDTAEFLAYIDSLSRAMLLSMGRDTAGLRATMVFNGDNAQALPEAVSDQQNRIAGFTRDHGQAGYLISADFDTQTLWLFFFANPDEQQALLSRGDVRP